MSCFGHIFKKVSAPCPIIAEAAVNVGDKVSYRNVEITQDSINIDRDIYNNLEAQIKSGADLRPVDTSNLLSSQDVAQRDITSGVAAEELLNQLENQETK